MSDSAARDPSPEPARPRSVWARVRALGAYLKANRARLFWAWIAYQSVKGALTLSFIWIPLILVWLNRS